MKRILFVTLFVMIAAMVFAQTPGRGAYVTLQLAPDHPGSIFDYVTNTGNTHSENYILRVLHVESNEVRGTDPASGGWPPTLMKIAALGVGTPNERAIIMINQSIWPAVWPAGSHLKFMVWYAQDTGIHSGEEPFPNYEYAEKTYEVPAGGGLILWHENPADRMTVPPAPQGAPTYQFAVTSNYAGAQIWKNGADTGETTPHTFEGETAAIAGVYTLNMPNVIWNPESYNYDGAASGSVHFVGSLIPGEAINPNPTDGAEIHIAHDDVATTYELSWEAPEAPAPAPNGYRLIWGAEPAVDLGDALTWTTPAIAEGVYTWKVIPYINDPAKGLGKSSGLVREMAPVRAKVATPQSKGDALLPATWSFTIIRGEAPTFSLEVTSEPSGLPIYKNNVDTEQVTPYTFTGVTADVAGTYKVVDEDYAFAPEDYVYAGTANETVHFVGTLIPDIPQDGNYALAVGINMSPSADLWTVPADASTPDIAALPNLDPTQSFFVGLTGTGIVDLTFTISEDGTWYVMAICGSVRYQANDWPLIVSGTPQTTVIPNVDFGAKAPVYVVATKGDDPTLPVELSYFNAVLTAENFVNLTWISQSETEMLGYRVYRAESNDQSTSILLTPSMIPATNTSSEQRYSLEDREVEIGTTYWYWLESVDYASSHIHGPVSMTVTGEIPPVLPTVTSMGNAYPNPFKQASNTSIDVRIKAGENGTVTIYNILGQAVKTFRVNEGDHKLTWNGKDARGNNCGSGIYFYKLSTPSTNVTKKMVIVK